MKRMPPVEHTSETPLYNSRVVLSFLRLLARSYPHIDQAALLDHAGMTVAEVNDPGKWFNQKEINRFSDRLLELTGNPWIFREAGRGLLNDVGFGTQYVLSSVGPARVLHLATALAAKYSRSCTYRAHQLDANRIEISVMPHPGTREIPIQCDNRIGSFEGIFPLFNQDLPTIEHPECMFAGGSQCRYIINWTETGSTAAKGWVTILWLVASLIVAVAAVSGNSPVPFALLGGGALGYLTFLFFCARKDRQNVDHLLDRSRVAFSQLESSSSGMNAERLASGLCTVMSGEEGEEGVIARTVDLLRGTVECGSCGVFLAETGDVLRWRGGVGFSEEVIRMLEQAPPRTETEKVPGDPVAGCFLNRRPVIVTPANAEAPIAPQWIRALGHDSVVCCPIICEDQPLGVLFVGSSPRRPLLVETDLNIVRGLAPVLGMSLQNARLIEEKKELLEASLKLDEARSRLQAVRSETVSRRRERGRIAAEIEEIGSPRFPHRWVSVIERSVTSLEQAVSIAAAMVPRMGDSLERDEIQSLQHQVGVMEEGVAGMRRSVSSLNLPEQATSTATRIDP